jgi:hypothetical protein
MPPIGGIMKRAQMFGGAQPALSEASVQRKEDLSRFPPKPEFRIRLWTAAEKKIARLLDSIRTGREARTQSGINRRTPLFIETELATTRDRAGVEPLAEAIASLVHKLEVENQKAAITVEEASFALHFRRSKEEVRQALLA